MDRPLTIKKQEAVRRAVEKTLLRMGFVAWDGYWSLELPLDAGRIALRATPSTATGSGSWEVQHAKKHEDVAFGIKGSSSVVRQWSDHDRVIWLVLDYIFRTGRYDGLCIAKKAHQERLNQAVKILSDATQILKDA